MSDVSSNDEYLVPPKKFLLKQGIGQYEDFRRIGDSLIGRLCRQKFVRENDTFLDIGCGLGRIARPLTRILTNKARYYGFDNNKESIEWCSRRYAGFSNFHFEWIDVKSVYYNPAGLLSPQQYRFPLPKGSVDFANLTSVFTHMFIEDVRHYLTEVGRMLRSGRHCLITYFLVDAQISAWYDNAASQGDWHPVPGGYIRDRDRPETVVLLKEEVVLPLYLEAGLEITSMTYGNWCKPTRANSTKGAFQDVIMAVKL